MAGLRDLTKRMNRLASDVSKHGSNAAANATLNMVRELTLRDTPVDTSQALSNWQVTLDTISARFIRPHVPGDEGSTRTASANVAYSKARAILRSKKPGQRIFLSNAAPYINRLNEGSSKQAPAGFIERAILLARLKGVDIRKVN